MSTLGISAVVFGCLFGGTILGMILRTRLPEHHLSPDSKDVVKVGTGLIGTMAALVLGLMVGSAKSSYDAQKSGLTQMSAKIILLDRALAHYGTETKEVRESLRGTVAGMLAQIWPEDRSGPAQLAPPGSGEVIYDQIQQLAPRNDAQRTLQNQALSMAVDIGQSRWLLFQQAGSSIATPFLVVLVFWLAIIFGSFGLFAPGNSTAIGTLLLCALSVAGAVFLILELDRPFDGILQVPSAPLHNALAKLGR